MALFILGLLTVGAVLIYTGLTGEPLTNVLRFPAKGGKERDR